MDKRCSFQRKAHKFFLVFLSQKSTRLLACFISELSVKRTQSLLPCICVHLRTYMPYVYRVSEVEPSLLRNNAQNGQNEENVCHTKSRSAVAYDGMTNLVLTSVKK